MKRPRQHHHPRAQSRTKDHHYHDVVSFKHAVQVWNTYALLYKVIDQEMLTLLANDVWVKGTAG
jgi:hypothetical protein